MFREYLSNPNIDTNGTIEFHGMQNPDSLRTGLPVGITGS